MSARLGLRVVTQQRVSMGRGAGKAFHTTAHLHIPGSVLRGALAKAWIARRGLPDSDFRRLFDGRVRFGPLFAEGSSVLPLSVRVCKYLSTHCTPWYADAAFPAAAGAAQPPTDWDDATGHWRSGRGDVVGPGGTTVPNDPVASTAIEPSTGTAKEANLFSRDSLRPGLVFTGAAVVGDDAALQLLIEAVSDLERLELGGRSSVMGSARLSLTGIEAPVGPEPSTDRVVLRLASPAFLVDNAGRPTLDVASALRRRAFSGEVERVWARSLTDGTGGFHGASRLPKPVDVGLAAGTTIALRTADDDIGVLGSLVTDGIGLRRSEGFGWLEVATGPWTTTSAVAADDSLIGEEGQDAGAFGDVRRRVQDLRLGHAAGRWFVARLRDVATTGGPSVDEALSQPGAMVLSRQQRQQVADVLAGQSPVVRRQLADSIDAGGQA